jgi:hypothetical protein
MSKAEHGECESNKGEMLYRCPQSCRVCHMYSIIREALGCEDLNDNCQMWARNGECKANPNYMFENCAVACGSCREKRQSCDRPPNTPPTVERGEINKTMVRILRDFPQYSPKAVSWPGGPKGSKAPWVITLKNFVTGALLPDTFLPGQGFMQLTLLCLIMSRVQRKKLTHSRIRVPITLTAALLVTSSRP